eukprot:m.490040 g.490040  ORF g.490040 m.490040 type:complete len:362 (+) comp27370_c0_seq1:66-1151(+)
MRVFACDEERKRLWQGTKAILAIYLSIVMWVGGWQLIAVVPRRPGRRPGNFRQHHLLPRPVAFMISGTVIMLLCDTFYANAGLGGSYLPVWVRRNRVLHWVRTVVGMWGSFMFWIGCYNVLSLHVAENTLLRNILLVVIGLVVLVATNTFFAMAYVYPEWSEGDPEDVSPQSPLAAHMWHFLRSLASLFAQNCVWLGAYELLSSDMPYYSGTVRETLFNLLYLASGLLLIVVTRSTKSLSWLPDLEFEDDDQPRCLTLWLRAFLAIVGQVTHNTGLWNLIGSAEGPSTNLRYALFLVLGGLALFFLNGLPANAGVAEDESEEEAAAASIEGSKRDVTLAGPIPGKTSFSDDMSLKTRLLPS